MEEGESHVHTDACYAQEQVLKCDYSRVHEHTDACFDALGRCICGFVEIQRHQHTEDCFQEEAVILQPGHTHSSRCYIRTLVCGKAEHIHTEKCHVVSQIQDAAEEAETTDETTEEAEPAETGSSDAQEDASSNLDGQEETALDEFVEMLDEDEPVPAADEAGNEEEQSEEAFSEREEPTGDETELTAEDVPVAGEGAAEDGLPDEDTNDLENAEETGTDAGPADEAGRADRPDGEDLPVPDGTETGPQKADEAYISDTAEDLSKGEAAADNTGEDDTATEGADDSAEADVQVDVPDVEPDAEPSEEPVATATDLNGEDLQGFEDASHFPADDQLQDENEIQAERADADEVEENLTEEISTPSDFVQPEEQKTDDDELITEGEPADVLADQYNVTTPSDLAEDEAGPETQRTLVSTGDGFMVTVAGLPEDLPENAALHVKEDSGLPLNHEMEDMAASIRVFSLSVRVDDLEVPLPERAMQVTFAFEGTPMTAVRVTLEDGSEQAADVRGAEVSFAVTRLGTVMLSWNSQEEDGQTAVLTHPIDVSQWVAPYSVRALIRAALEDEASGETALQTDGQCAEGAMDETMGPEADQMGAEAWVIHVNPDEIQVSFDQDDWLLTPRMSLDRAEVRVETGRETYMLILEHAKTWLKTLDLGMVRISAIGEEMPGDVSGSACLIQDEQEISGALQAVEAFLSGAQEHVTELSAKGRRKAQRQAADEEKREGSGHYQVFDISLEHVDQETFAEGFRVDVTMPEALVGRAFRLYHLHDGKVTDISDTMVLGGTQISDDIRRVDAFSFTTDGFSQFVLSYTVDFYYGDYEWHIDGGSEIRLSELFAALGIDRDAADVVSVSFTDPQLIEIKEIADEADGIWKDWMLISLQAFDTIECLTVIFSDGGVLEIRVEDAQYIVHIRINDPNAGVFQSKYYGTTVNGIGKTGTNTDEKSKDKNNPTLNYGFNPIPNTGYSFVYWIQDDSTTVMSLTNNTTVTAETTFDGYFAPTNEYLIRYTIGDNGTVTGAKSFESTSGTKYFSYSGSVGATATPDNGYIFSGWYNGNTLVSTEMTLPANAVSSNVLLEARFEESSGDNQEEITGFHYSVNDTSAGYIKLVNSNGELSGKDNSGIYLTDGLNSTKNSSARFAEPVANSGYRFVNWTNSGEVYTKRDGKNANTIRPKLKEYADGLYSTGTFIANFVPENDYLVTLVAGEGGYTTIGGDRNRTTIRLSEMRSDLGIYAWPNAGYHTLGWADETGSIIGGLHAGDARLYSDAVPQNRDSVITAILKRSQTSTSIIAVAVHMVR
ncbi:MAG: hypothetical protein IJ083_01855 [Clostridia bacterium]|nr:hypothetical protein [Clostridia bacterium]